MRLAEFIEGHMEVILAEWETFARTLYPKSARMTSPQLRDHAQQILAAVVKDLSTRQTKLAQAEKSRGHAPLPSEAHESAAQTHAVLRAQSGMEINALVAEYRALRASVLRLWEEAGESSRESLQEMTRFNEAIDQAVAESVLFFSAQVERSRNLLLGMVGHDMRNPLNAILLTARSLEELTPGAEISEAAEILTRSGAAIQALLDDLVDFNRTQMGLTIPIKLNDADLAALYAREVNQHQTAHPGRRIQLAMEGEVTGRWDGKRLQQVLRNLLANALAYGTPGEPVRVEVRGEEAAVQIRVTNRGDTIDSQALEQLFEPLRRGDSGARRANEEGVGLGLYIVREITRAHGGEVSARSADGETVFTVSLPRRSAVESDEAS